MSEAGTFTLDDLDRPEVRGILGMMIMATCPVAHLFRDTGEDIPRKVEAEQAYVLGWLLKLALEHGDGWGRHAADEVSRRQLIVAERAGG